MTNKVYHQVEGGSMLFTDDTSDYIDPSGLAFPAGHTQTLFLRSTSYDITHSGADNPKWRQMVGKTDVTNSYSGSRVLFFPATWHAHAYFRNGPAPPYKKPAYETIETVGEPARPVPTFPTIDSSVYNTALSSFIPRCNRQITQFTAGQFVGELKETIHGLKHPLNGVRGLLSSYLDGLGRKRGRAPKNPKKRRKFLAEQYLELQFGLKPLMGDVKSAAEAVARLANGFVPSAHVTSSAQKEALVSESPLNINTNGRLRWGSSLLTIDRTSVRFFGAVKLENSGGGSLDVVGLRRDLFIPTLWELIPYSWLVDYFTNVGQMIEAACFNTSRLIYSGVTTKGERIFTNRPHGDMTNTADTTLLNSSFSGGESKMIVMTIGRGAVTPTIPKLTFSVPHSYWQWANMASVAAQQRRLVPY